MGKATDVVRQVIQFMRQGGGPGVELKELMVPARLARDLARELGETGDVVFEGVAIRAMTAREELLARGVDYALVRWHQPTSLPDMASLLKAVPDAELMDLIPVVLAQEYDAAGVDDPAQDMNQEELDDMKEKIRELGFVDTTI